VTLSSALTASAQLPERTRSSAPGPGVQRLAGSFKAAPELATGRLLLGSRVIGSGYIGFCRRCSPFLLERSAGSRERRGVRCQQKHCAPSKPGSPPAGRRTQTPATALAKRCPSGASPLSRSQRADRGNNGRPRRGGKRVPLRVRPSRLQLGGRTLANGVPSSSVWRGSLRGRPGPLRRGRRSPGRVPSWVRRARPGLRYGLRGTATSR
jgi:hypothetical protein